jgi:hypothetical protein
MKKMKRIPPFHYALFDCQNEFCGVYPTYVQASDDAVGPRFRPDYTIARYRRIRTLRILLKA